MSFVTAGIVGGPTVSGALLQLFGYWAAWSLPLMYQKAEQSILLGYRCWELTWQQVCSMNQYLKIRGLQSYAL
jgi:hypothetical protein